MSANTSLEAEQAGSPMESLHFADIGKAVAKQFQSMTETGLYYAAVDKDALWDTYLGSFPPGSNPVFKKRTEHDCSACRSFIRTIGNVVTIVNGELVTLWDFEIGGAYQVVADAMARLVRLGTIENVFIHMEPVVGTGQNFQLLEDKSVLTWEHFFVNLPAESVMKGIHIGPKKSEMRGSFDVMYRGLKEITAEAINTVLELIAQNSLYRGEENQAAVESFRRLKAEFDALKTDEEKTLYCWRRVGTAGAIARLRNTAIGTLLTDLSEDKDLEASVKSFESKVAPTNYKRPTALVTKDMIKRAQATVAELGLSSALERRYATIDDITVNNVLFADRTAKAEMNVFDTLSAATPANPKSMEKVEEITIEDFLTNVLPKAETLEVMVENRHASNLVSLIAPVDPTAKRLFKWPNNFSWSYAGELADSIKERVKKAGGNVTGDFRASLSWFNYDDLDLHLVEPNGGQRIYYANKCPDRFGTNGQLDVDMNAGTGSTRNAVENIVYPSRTRMMEGKYQLFVNNFTKRESQDVGFEVEMEFDGQIYSFSYTKPVKDKESVVVAEFQFSRTTGLKILNSLPSTQVSKVLWGTPTQTFRKVKVLMLSPNHWDGHATGNKHYFFMLDGCLNEGKARGFFNEFLSQELDPHRKVLEIVGAKMKTEESGRQLSGVGFSSTQRNHLLCQVSGAFKRTVKITF